MNKPALLLAGMLLASAVWSAVALGRIRRYSRQERQTHLDPVTGLRHRDAFMEQLRRALSRRSGPWNNAVLLIRIENHADLKERFGSSVADAFLAAISQRLTQQRPPRIWGRMDEAVLALLWDQADNEATLLHAGTTLVNMARLPVVLDGAALEVEASCGIAVYPRDGVDATQLIERASAALYHARQRASGVAQHGGRTARPGPNWLGSELMGELEHAVSNGDLRAVLQPVIDLSNGRTIGAEALIRWHHPTHGVLMPDRFVPLAEQTGAITQVTDFMVTQAAALLERWHMQHLDLTLSVNISARDLVDPAFAARVVGTLSTHGVRPDRLEIELTEHAMSRDEDLSRTVLHQMRESGVRLAVDDFGTGYSSLIHLKDLRVDTLKLDQGFVQDLLRSTQAAAIVRAVMGLADGLHARVLAEGIETHAVRRALQAMGCDAGQGFYFARPMDEAGFLTWLRDPAHMHALGA